MDVKGFWQLKAAKQKDLAERHPDGCLYVTSLDNPEKGTTPGAVIAVNLDNAARLIAMGTHRESTSDEVATVVKQEAARYRASREAEVRAGRGDPVEQAAAIEMRVRKLMFEGEPTQDKPAPVQPPVRTK